MADLPRDLRCAIELLFGHIRDANPGKAWSVDAFWHRRSGHSYSHYIACIHAFPRVALTGGWLEIDLSGLGITFLPLEFWQVLSRLPGVGIVWVDLSNNGLNPYWPTVQSVVRRTSGASPYVEARVHGDIDLELN